MHVASLKHKSALGLSKGAAERSMYKGSFDEDEFGIYVTLLETVLFNRFGALRAFYPL